MHPALLSLSRSPPSASAAGPEQDIDINQQITPPCSQCNSGLSIYAILIGIDTYKKSPLNGAVQDAEAMRTYLENDLQVPHTQIRTVTYKEATRSAIILAFDELAYDDRIGNGDPILIFYAGHGTEIDAPATWESGSAGVKIQAIVPYSDGAMRIIPDYILGRLINQIAQKKGNNIVS